MGDATILAAGGHINLTSDEMIEELLRRGAGNRVLKRLQTTTLMSEMFERGAKEADTRILVVTQLGEHVSMWPEGSTLEGTVETMVERARDTMTKAADCDVMEVRVLKTKSVCTTVQVIDQDDADGDVTYSG
jgi:hypothetical protein